MSEQILISLSLIVGLATILTILARIIKQPPIIAYLVAGILIGPVFLGIVNPATTSSDIIQLFAHIGVALLLFIVGLSLDLRVFKEVGKVSSLAGICEIIATASIGFLIALAIGLKNTTALYIATALAFSSTVVVVKILSDKKEMDTLHAKIALGILIIEDLVAALVLMIVPLLRDGSPTTILFALIKIIITIAIIFAISNFALRRFLDYIATSQEVLFLFGIAWEMTIAALFSYLGLSIEIGALIAGMSLASTHYTIELGGKIKPLRDFFIILFFVFFGSQLTGPITLTMIKQALIFSAFILIGKPIIVMSILRIFSYKKRTNFLAGASLAQISEFSLILILLGASLGYISQQIISLTILVALITICISSYSIFYSQSIFNKLSKVLTIFEEKSDNEKIKEKSYDVVLLGYHRMGFKVLQSIRKLTKSYMVADYNPKVILALSKVNINAVYGDAADRYFLSELPLDKAKLIISTIPQEDVNITIKDHLKDIGSKAAFIATAEQPREALDLYKQGVDFVIVPHHVGGDYLSHIIEKLKANKSQYQELGKKHAQDLHNSKNNSVYD